jgi:hypothetical protein
LLPLANQRHERISSKISPPSQQSPFDNLMNALARTIKWRKGRLIRTRDLT